jgi:hypothetical protein
MNVLTRGSLGSSLGCGTRMIGTGPVLSHFNPTVFSPAICGLSRSSKYLVVPDKSRSSVELDCTRVAIISPTWNMFHHPILKHTEPHLCRDASYFLEECKRGAAHSSVLFIPKLSYFSWRENMRRPLVFKMVPYRMVQPFIDRWMVSTPYAPFSATPQTGIVPSVSPPISFQHPLFKHT